MTIPGSVPRNLRLLQGCHFAERCPECRQDCLNHHPLLQELEGGRRAVRCPFIQPAAAPSASQTRHFASVAPEADVPPLFSATDLRVSYSLGKGRILRAIDGIDITLNKGETLAIVGESGCGKSTLGKVLIGLAPALSGRIRLNGQNDIDLAASSPAALAPLRQTIRMVFQDPFSSLDPRMPAGESIAEGIGPGNFKLDPATRRRRVNALLEEVGLTPSDYDRYPHQFSGGQRQRIGLARALAAQPEIIICDECTSALDVSVQAQILNLLHELQKQKHIAYLFITHDLSVVGHIADRIAVMYLGRIVESGTATEILLQPAHPYTRALLAAAPRMHSGSSRENPEAGPIELKGELPSPTTEYHGCPFASRCPQAAATCTSALPPWHTLTANHHVRCHLQYQAGTP